MNTEQTFEQIAREQGAMIKRIAWSYEADANLVEELVQEIHLAIWRAIPSFRGGSSLRTFVARIATNRALSHVARAMRSPQSSGLDPELPGADDDPEMRAVESDQRARLVSAVRSLPLAYRQAAALTLEGLTPKEVAGTLGITTNAVAIRMSRAKELLRHHLGDQA
jgi:RNA polymerase sigma factor (sigma-70 family)